MVGTPTLPAPVQAALAEIKSALAELYQERLSGIYLYGSYARGDYTDDSDVDLLLALNGEVDPYREIDRVSSIVSEISLNYDQLIAVFPVSEHWLRERTSPLFHTLRREAAPL